MQKLDVKDFLLGKGENHNVNYHLYSSKIESLDKFDIPKSLDKAGKGPKCYEGSIISSHRGVCFTGLLRNISKTKNRLVYILNKSRSPQVSEDEKIRWLDICVKAKALPDYIRNSDIKRDRYVIKLDSPLSPSLLYIYITCLRWIQECPEFVKNMLILIDKYRINFYTAWLVASCFSVSNTWHNIVPHGCCYRGGLASIIDKDEVNIAAARGFRNFLKDPTKYDKRVCIKSADATFLAETNVREASDIFGGNFLMNISRILDSKLNGAMESG